MWIGYVEPNGFHDFAVLIFVWHDPKMYDQNYHVVTVDFVLEAFILYWFVTADTIIFAVYDI